MKKIRESTLNIFFSFQCIYTQDGNQSDDFMIPDLFYFVECANRDESDLSLKALHIGLYLDLSPRKLQLCGYCNMPICLI